MKKTMAISALALMLTACGGSSSNGGYTPAPVAMMDAFFAAVSAIIGTSPENTEPTATDSTTATTPENTEPAAV